VADTVDVKKTASFPFKKSDAQGLCYRCEHRARARETGHGPRAQCTDEGAVWSCYMYQPVRPLVLIANDGEERSIYRPAMIAGRSHAKGLMEGKLTTGTLAGCLELDGSLVQWWEPNSVDETDEPLGNDSRETK